MSKSFLSFPALLWSSVLKLESILSCQFVVGFQTVMQGRRVLSHTDDMRLLNS